jgi:iron uptake system component EfeO
MALVRGSGVGLRAALVALAAVVLVVGGCSSDKKSGGGGRHVAITLTDDGCAPQNITTTAGPHTFEVKNSGSAAVTEFEILQGDTIVGEVENVTPGADKSFSLTLKTGTYKTECPNGKKFHEGSIVVGA